MGSAYWILWILGFLPQLTETSKTEVFDAPDVRVEVVGDQTDAFYLSKTHDLQLKCAIRLPSSVRLSETTRNIIWRYNEEDLSKAGLPVDSIQSDGDRLLLKATADVDLLVGKYSCNVSWPTYGTVLSPPVQIHLASIKKFKNDFPNEERAIVGHTAFLPCSAPESYPGPPKIWFVINGTKEINISHDRYFLTTNGLHIGSVEKSDRGTYICKAMNTITGQIRDSKSIDFAVFDEDKSTPSTTGNDDNPFRPALYFQQRNSLNVRRGDNVTLSCVMNDGFGRSATTIRWEKYGGNLPSAEKRTQIFGNLILFNVTKDEEGTYICRIGSTGNSSGASTVDRKQTTSTSHGRYIMYSLRVYDRLKAKLTIERDSEDDKSATSGYPYRLTCQTSSGLASDLEFWINGRPLLSQSLTPVRTKFQSGESLKWSFTLTEATLKKGVYQCMVHGQKPFDETFVETDNLYVDTSWNDETTTSMTRMDTIGVTQATGHLDSDSIFASRKAPPKIRIGPENETTSVGLSATFVCQVSANTEAVFWLKDGIRIWDDESDDEDDDESNIEDKDVEHRKKYKRIGTGSLKIEKTTIGDRGWYTCVAFNLYGNSTAKAFLDFDDYIIATTDERRTGDVGFGGNGQSTNSAEEEEIEERDPKNSRRKKIRLDAPTVLRYSNTSVYLRWQLSPEQRRSNSGLRFFKLQYKKLMKGEREKSPAWKTLDQELPSHSHSGTIDGLEPGQKYKFRYAAVYENNVQAISKMTPPYEMIIERKRQPPKLAPILRNVKVLSWSAIALYWDYPSEEQAPVEGFTILYRRLYYADTSTTYDTEHVIGGWTREHVLSHLLPATLYQIKIVAFNTAGRSRESNVIEESTLKEIQGSDGTKQSRTFDAVMPMDPLFANDAQAKQLDVPRNNKGVTWAPTSANGSEKNSSIWAWVNIGQNTILYLIGGFVIALVSLSGLFMIALMLKRSRDKKMIEAARGKFRDTSKKIYREQELSNNRSVMKDMYPPVSNSASFQHSTADSGDEEHGESQDQPNSQCAVGMNSSATCIPPPPSVTGTGYPNGSIRRDAGIMNIYPNPFDFVGEKDTPKSDRRRVLRNQQPDVFSADEGDELLSAEERLLADVYGTECDLNKNDLLYGIRALGGSSNSASISGRHLAVNYRPIPPPLILTAASALTSTGEFGHGLNRSFLNTSSPHASLASDYSSSKDGDAHSSSSNGGTTANHTSFLPAPIFSKQFSEHVESNEANKRMPTPVPTFQCQKPWNAVRPSDSLRIEKQRPQKTDDSASIRSHQTNGVLKNGAASPMSISSHASIGSNSATSANGIKSNFSTFRPESGRQEHYRNHNPLLLNDSNRMHRNRLSDGYCSDA